MLISTFTNLQAQDCTPVEVAWPDFVAYLANPPEYPEKAALPLLKMAEFGNVRSDKGALRNDDNVVAICGVEGDHDAGTMPPELAAALLTAAGIQAVIYTSASHTNAVIDGDGVIVKAAHYRWRVLCPTSQRYAPSARYELTARLNGVLGGVLAGESFTLSQSFYFGRVAGVEYVCLPIDGKPIDLLPLAPLYPARGASGTGATNWSLSSEPVPEWRGPTDDDDLLRRALKSKSAASAFGNRASFADLWERNVEALAKAWPGDPYNESDADAALVAHLSFWTGKHGERIHALMLRSGLVRDKWEREDYLPRTIAAILARPGDVLTDKAPGPLPLGVTPPAGAVALPDVEMTMLQTGTQDAVALIFVRQAAGSLLFNHSRASWMEWDGTRWRVELTDRAFDFARALARQMNLAGKSTMGSASFCKGVEQFARADRALAVAGIEFDRDNYLLNTPGGTFDLRTNTLRQHDPDDRLTMCTAVTPSHEGGATFDKFMGEITMGNRELAEFLQVSLGACLSGAIESHWLLFWIGQGRNGKNTLGDLVQDAMGDYARKVPTSTLMAKSHEGHPTEIANLQGIRLALSSEINDGEYWHEARINEVTGDSTLSARFMRGDLFTFQRTHKHLIYGNHRPQLRTVGNAITSRIKIVPFKASFLGREDADLPRRLRESLGYVLAWLIEGHSKWLAAGKRLPPCQAVEAESADYFAAQSTVDMWLAERVQILTTDARNVLALHKGGELYRDYSEWKKERGENPVSMTRWAESLRRFEKVKSSGVRYRGLMLIPQVGNVPFPLSTNSQLSYVN
jgi:P4 family phage/plasmid primase-like protien